MERHAGRILIAGGLVSANIFLVALVHHFYDLGALGALLVMGLAFVGFLLLHRAVTRMMRGAVGAARRESRVSRHMMAAVEQIGTEGAGLEGTVDALSASARSAGLEVYVWESAERSLWCPGQSQQQIPFTAAQARALEAWLDGCGVRRIDLATKAVPLPADLVQRQRNGWLVISPMRSADALLGFVLRRHTDLSALRRAEDDALVGAIASIGSVAIGKALIVDREARRARDNELLLRSVHAANESRQRDRLVEHVRQAVEASGAQRGAIFALDSGRLRLMGAAGIDRVNASGAGTLRMRSRLAALALQAGTAPFHCGIEELDESSAVVLGRLGFDDEVLVQGVRDSNGLVGLLVLEQSTDAMDVGTDDLMSAIGRQAGMSIERGRMLRSIRKRSRHLACTPKLARSLTGQREPADIARIAARELNEGFGFGRVSIALIPTGATTDDIRIVASSGAPASGDPSHGLSPTPIVESTDSMLECCRTGRPFVGVVGDVDEASISAHQDPDAPVGCRGRIFVPVVGRERRVVGVIAVYEQDPDVLGEDDLHMLETIADQLGGTIEQAELFHSLERSYFETVEALSSALEAKDAYTLDHARSITEMSADVGRRLGMREDEVRDLKLGALLHDIGKIGVPTEILSKNGPLTDDEFEIMKEHTIIGERIIADVEFLQGVRPLVLHEHERWDGRGYPHNLRGEEIPLGARIIFVCDSWHAMTSDRPYRNAMPDAAALAELRNGAGSQFDPAVVDAFCDLMESSAMVRERAMAAAVPVARSVPADRVPS
jgi:GAF domain-containing protein